MLRFQHKMITAFVLFVLLPIIILGIISYAISSATLQQNISNQTVQTLSAVDRNLLAAVSEVDSFSDYVISSSEIQSYLSTNDTTSIYEFYNKQQAIAGTMYGNSQIDDFILYRQDGNVTHITHADVPTLETLKSSWVFDQVIKQKGSPLWLTPYENKNLFPQEEYMLTQVRVIKDINTLNDLGYLVLNIKLNLFDTIFEDIYGGPSYEMILNNEGKILYSLNRDLIGQDLDISQISEMKTNEMGYLIDKWNNEKSLITYMPSSFKTGTNSSLILVSIKPWKTIGNDIVQIRNTTLVIVAFTILVAGFFNVLYLKRISLFIQELLKRMKQVEEGRLNKRMGTFKLKELRNISIGFNNMVKRIQQLLVDVENEQERKREAQFMVLQQQINPHFLYNTLESINALAAMNGQKQISKMTINLGKLLRISINGGYEVTVKDEIRHVISYLEIQKIRYDNSFSYGIEVEDDLNHYSVLKLILQPLVENSLHHAFSQQDQHKGFIKIRGAIRNRKGELWVEDNGKGIDKNRLMQLNSLKVEKNNQRLGHGIRNVDERLRLFYGEKYGLIICSTENAGTIIKISFPVKGD
ncbi:cache domain-containing sensor histidine kinase [Metabacillus sp. Hm71]|uniref:cache domain-containing sensor histidine kinase n=1 Tax=Metabacillus sp. Hm71 TaxID=3450743 RepID=UPI003F42AF0A